LVRTLDGRVLHWTSGLRDLYGWTAEEAIGRIAHELRGTSFSVPQQEIEAELLSTGTWRGEVVHRHRDGRQVIVTSQWALHRGEAGQPASVLEFDVDMTETRQTQMMIEEREARLHSILDTAPDAIITIDASGVIQSFSNAAERMFGYA